MPLGADVANVAEHAGPDDVVGVGVEQAVMALMADRQYPVLRVGRGDHRLALRDVPTHELFAHHVLAGVHRVDGDAGVHVQRQGDDDRLDVGVGQKLLVAFIEPDVAAGIAAVVIIEPARGPVGSPVKMRFWL